MRLLLHHKHLHVYNIEENKKFVRVHQNVVAKLPFTGVWTVSTSSTLERSVKCTNNSDMINEAQTEGGGGGGEGLSSLLHKIKMALLPTF